MNTSRIFTLPDLLSSKPLLNEAVGMLAAGALCVYPTETIYGIGGRADLASVEQKILLVKKRPPENPMILLGASLSVFDYLDLIWPHTAIVLAKHFWPGNLTLVLRRKSGAGTVGIRVSDHPFIQAIGPLLSKPLFSTSANYSGEKYDGDPHRLRTLFEYSVDMIVDAGSLPFSPPSTVVRIDTDGAFSILREGAVAAEKIDALIGRK